MHRFNFVIALRNVWKNKSLFAINVAGLSLGIATCLTMMLFVMDELSYDRFHAKADRIVRVILQGKVNGEVIKEAVTPAPVASALQQEFAEVEIATRLRRAGSPLIRYQGTAFRNSTLAYVDPNFFQVFSFSFLRGNPITALSEPNTVIITHDEANKYFGEADPINKILELGDPAETFKVTGVIDNIPTNAHFHFGMFASMAGLAHAREDNWMASNYYTYLVLAREANHQSFESKLPTIINKYMGPQVEQLGMSYEKFKENGNEIGLFIQPLTSIYLHSDMDSQSELEAGGDINTVYIFSAVAVFMLLIACVNFMNLSTAGATKRNKEIGVKKVLGSAKRQLVYQFLTESFIATVLAMVLAVVLVILTLPVFNQLSGKVLAVGSLLQFNVVLGLAALVVIITLLAGSYPAFFLSSVKPITALRNNGGNVGRSAGIRSALVVFQFVVSGVLILSMIIIQLQMTYIQNKDLGYERDQLLVLRESKLLGMHEEAFKNQLMSDSRIERITMSAFIPAGPTDNNLTSVYPDQQPEAVRRIIEYNIDDQYIPTLGMELVAGRNFSGIPETERDHVILNETAVHVFGLGENPIGKIIVAGTNDPDKKQRLTVIGVVKDFHFRSLREPIAPVMMRNNPYGGLIIRTKTKEMVSLIASLESTWKSFHVEEPFTYALLDELYNETYLSEQKMGNILGIFGMITIAVACLGLFGLVTFSAAQRVKEIGIRKVLGANVSEIVSLLSKDMMLLIVISFVIAFPLGYYFMDRWLMHFAYRIDVPWWVFGLAGLSTLVVAFLTMSFRTIQSARANPVESLRRDG